MHRMFAALFAAVSCAAVAQAQDSATTAPPAAPPLTLDQAVAAAGGSAPAADAARADIAAAEAGRTIAGLRPNPTVSTEVENIAGTGRSEEHTSELQSLMRISYAVFCLKKKKNTTNN